MLTMVGLTGTCNDRPLANLWRQDLQAGAGLLPARPKQSLFLTVTKSDATVQIIIGNWAGLVISRHHCSGSRIRNRVANRRSSMASCSSVRDYWRTKRIRRSCAYAWRSTIWSSDNFSEVQSIASCRVSFTAQSRFRLSVLLGIGIWAV